MNKGTGRFLNVASDNLYQIKFEPLQTSRMSRFRSGLSFLCELCALCGLYLIFIGVYRRSSAANL